MERKTIIIDNEETNYEISSDGKVFNKKDRQRVKRAADAQRIGKGYYWILDSQNITINDLITTLS